MADHRRQLFEIVVLGNRSTTAADCADAVPLEPDAAKAGVGDGQTNSGTDNDLGLVSSA